MRQLTTSFLTSVGVTALLIPTIFYSLFNVRKFRYPVIAEGGVLETITAVLFLAGAVVSIVALIRFPSLRREWRFSLLALGTFFGFQDEFDLFARLGVRKPSKGVDGVHDVFELVDRAIAPYSPFPRDDIAFLLALGFGIGLFFLYRMMRQVPQLQYLFCGAVCVAIAQYLDVHFPVALEGAV